MHNVELWALHCLIPMSTRVVQVRHRLIHWGISDCAGSLVSVYPTFVVKIHLAQISGWGKVKSSLHSWLSVHLVEVVAIVEEVLGIVDRVTILR